MSDVLDAAVAAWQAEQMLADWDVEAVRAAVEEGRASGPTIPADEVFDRVLHAAR
ncbi:MAG: hypothetical protein NTW56_09855 [Alphaproteobacteria bacterium]|nr:hypothetical protein [Alphaproteobacteria bacterium]